MCQYSSDNGHATDWHLVHIGVRTKSSSVPTDNHHRDLTDVPPGVLCRALRRAARGASSWKRPRSFPRAASRPRTRGFGRTRRSRRSSESSTLRTRRPRKSASSSRMRAARRLLSRRGSRKARIARVAWTHPSRSPTKTDGQTTVPYLFLSVPTFCDGEPFWALIGSSSRVVYGPTDVPWAKDYPTPKGMTEDDLQHVEDAFVAATKRSALAGCQHPYYFA